MKYVTYVGSATDAGNPDGIHILESDAETGTFRLLGKIGTLGNPIYMAVNRDCTRLYSAASSPSFGPRGRNGGLVSFAVKGDRLEFMNEIPTGWTTPCHVSLSPNEDALVYAEYSCGTAGYANLKADGTIDPAFSGRPGEIDPRFQVRHVGDGPNKPRQDAAHCHCAIVTPDSRFQLVVDLTLDQVKAYDFAGRAAGMKEVASATIHTKPLGAGPRHVVFHPNGKFMFVIFELGNYVASYRYTGAGFEFISQFPLMTEPAGMEGCKAAAIKVSEDGSQLFCSNRDISKKGYDSISVFNVDQKTGQLAFLNNAKLAGSFPRDFEFMPGGRFCIVGLKMSGVIASYAYDRAKGTFTEVQRMENVFRPLYFRFKTR